MGHFGNMEKGKKLLIFVAEDYGLLSHRLPVALGARDAGYRVSIVCRVSTHQGYLESLGLTVYPLHHFHRSRLNPFQELRCLWEIFCLYRRVKPDLVHQVAMKPVVYGSIAAFLARVPRVVNALGGLGFAFIAKGVKARLVRWVSQVVFRFAFNRPNSRLILQNPDDVRQLGTLINPHYLVLIRGSGVDLKDFVPRPEPMGMVKIILVARLLWDKGIGELVAAARLLKDRGVKAQVILYGDPDPANPNSVPADTIETWRREGLVSLPGPTKRVAQAYQDGHIAVLPSYREGLPKSLLEAMACGRPIVTTDVPGCREVVVPGENGLLVPVKNPKALADALETLVYDPDKRQRFGAASRQLAEAHFSVDHVVQETLRVYGDLFK